MLKKKKNCLVAKKYINERLLNYSACRSVYVLPLS